MQVLQALQMKYGDLYQQDNVVLSGTHTHCGLGGYFQYTLFMMTSKGYIKESTQPLVNGIVKVCVCDSRTHIRSKIFRLITGMEQVSVPSIVWASELEKTEE